ncbi:hypothetical protein [Caulobacter sp. 17J80-11]|uniref:hypothetical protein n=1 Tax=Caulobacter sp. 17J80-11 TaxID=2763502 RepID=UPI001653B72E|nr:hypothetical protein [Caulobacter sp. 17J80-11]MBC6980904.1 hypothetical protein [Caulobacter sp. 17J80-11]
MAKPLAQFDIDETEDGYLLHIGDGEATHAYEIAPEQMAAIMETLLEMIPEVDDEVFDDEEFEDDEYEEEEEAPETTN